MTTRRRLISPRNFRNMNVFKKVSNGERITIADALSLRAESMFTLAKEAEARMRILNDSDSVGYIVNRMVNYSNICKARCKFCAYHAKAGRVPPFRMSDDEIFDLCADTVRQGGVQIMLQGGLHPEFTLPWAEKLLKRIKAAFPNLWLHVFSPSEIVWFAREGGISVLDCLSRLKDSGADSVPGAADLLVPRIRRELCGNKCTVEEWTGVMRALAKLKMTSSATMTFGMGETFEERIEHLAVVRKVQDETGVFNAFIAWPVAPENTEIEGKVERVSSPEFLRMLAISRIFLDNIKYVQSGWLTEGLRCAEIALFFGANDVGGVLMDEMVVRAAGIDNRATAENMRRLIKNAGKTPRERDGLYRTIKVFK